MRLRLAFVAVVGVVGCVAPVEGVPPLPAPSVAGDAIDTDDPVVPAPEDLDGPIADAAPTLWLRASDLRVPDRTRVRRWRARAGEDALQTEDRRIPIARSSRFVPFPVVQFDGVDDGLFVVPPPIAEGEADRFTLFVVAVSWDPSGHVAGMLRVLDPDEAIDGHGLAVLGGQPNAAASSVQYGWRGVAGDVAIDDGLPHLWTLEIGPSQSTLYVDGAAVGTTFVEPTDRVLGAFTLGSTATDSRNPDQLLALEGEVAEVVVVPRRTPSCERHAIEARLAQLYGLEVATEIAPPRAAWEAMDAEVDEDGGVSAWPAEEGLGPRVGALRASGDRRPRVVDGAVRFDGVDDRLILPLDPFDDAPVPEVVAGVVFSTEDDAGHLVGSGLGIEDALARWGTALVVDDGALVAKGADQASSVRLVGGDVDDGLPHIAVARWHAAGIELWLDGAHDAVTADLPIAGLSRSTMGASDGSAADRADDPLAVDVVAVRLWLGRHDSCDLAAIADVLASIPR